MKFESIVRFDRQTNDITAMSQTSNAFESKDDRQLSSTISNSTYVPIIPLMFPYTTPGNQSVQQTFYMPTVYPNFQPYPFANRLPHPANYPISFNPYYQIYSPTNNFIHPSISMPNLPPLMSNQQHQQSFSTSETMIKSQNSERNQTLSIRECQSPGISTIPTTSDETKRTLISQIDENTSNETSPREAESTTRTSSSEDQVESDPSDEDFLTFIEQKNKRKTSLISTMSKIDVKSENLSSYRLLFDNLIETTYKSIEETKKSPKKISVDDSSIQCEIVSDRIHRSTQTVSTKTNVDLIEDQTFQTLKLMENLVEEFRRISQSDRRIELKSMANICDELHQSIVFMNLIATSKRPPTNVEKPFRNILEETENNFVHISKYPPSFHQPIVTGRGNRQLIGSTNFSPVPSFSCRSIESSAKTESNKLCLICQKPVDQNEKFLHQWCR